MCCFLFSGTVKKKVLKMNLFNILAIKYEKQEKNHER